MAAAQLAELRPGAGWTRKRVEHLVVGVRNRLSADGVAGLTRAEIGEPVGNALNHNLLRELLLTTTLVPRTWPSWTMTVRTSEPRAV